jgi:threonine/homoserine/homoserine lactone efflux protein
MVLRFVSTDQPSAPQFATLGALFLALEWVAIAAYADMGSHLRKWFSVPRRRQVFNRVCGSLLGAAGAGILLARRSAN